MCSTIIINTKKSPAPLGPYVQAIKVNNIVFVSGQIGICNETKKIPDNIQQQTYYSLKNIKNIITEAKLNINNIVKTTLFISNISELPEINISYEKFFKEFFCLNFPARSCVEVSQLPKNARIEIEAIAIYHGN